MDEKQKELEQKATHLQKVVEECWDGSKGIYHRRDWLSHQSPAGSELGYLKGSGTLDLGTSLPYPTRLMILISHKQEVGSEFSVTLLGGNDEERILQTFSRDDLSWSQGCWIGTSRHLYTVIESIQVDGLERKNQVVLKVMDFNRRDITQFLPIWAGIPGFDRVERMLTCQLRKGKRFYGLFGIPCEAGSSKKSGLSHDIVNLPINAMLAEGLAASGRCEEAVVLMGGIMGAVVSNLKIYKSFMQYFDAQTGNGHGERNTVTGLAPLGTFLKLLGVDFSPPGRVKILGKNPFPWQVTVKYRGITVTRKMDRTEVVFPGGQSITLSDPTEAVVEAE